MNPELFIPVGFGLFILTAWSIGTYNKFIKLRNRIEMARSSIDVALKRRANLIPSLVKVIEGYGEHEAKIFLEKTRQLTKRGDGPRNLEDESKISRSLGGLLAVAEAYPELKASENFLNLQQSLNEIEAEIQRARDRYNNVISRFNTLVESFPASLIAARFHFTKQPYLSLELATQREMPDVSISIDPDGKADKQR